MNGVRRESRLIRLLMAAALVLFVAACSSSGGIKNDRDMYKEQADNLTAELEMVKAQLATVTGERDQALSDLMDAQGMVSTLNGQVSDLDGQVSDLNGQVTGLNDQISSLTTMRDDLTTMRDSLQMQVDTLTEQAGADGMTISGLNDQITGLDDQITGLNGQITGLEGMITGLEGQITDLMTEKDGVQGMLDVANLRVTELEEMLAAANTELNTLKRDLAAEIAAAAAKKASDGAKELFKALDTEATNTERLGAEPAPDVTVKASSGGVLTAEAEDFDAAGGADRISGMRGATLTMDDQTIVVYTNIEDAEATEIGSVYRSAADPGKPAVYEVTSDGALSTISWGHVKRADKAHTEEDDDGTAVLTFLGSVRGVDGSFTCEGTCDPPTAAELADHDGTAVNETDWEFKPDVAKDTIDVADGDGYLMFGWWLDKGDDAEGPFKVDTFATAVGLMENTADQDTLEGTATYTGGAAGKYAILSTTADSAEGGHFTASARIAANFEAGDDDDMISIKGTIDDFMTGETARPNWKVTLTVPDFDAFVADGITDQTTDADAAWDTGGAVDGEGTWTANFWGEGDDDEPTAITGEFNAEISDIARLAGAFGVTK